MPLPEKLPIHSDARLADLGALLVFRHWLGSLLQEMAGPDDGCLDAIREQHSSAAPMDPEANLEPQGFARLFF